MATKIRGDAVVTANRLGDGAVVYLTHAGSWSEWLDEGEVAESEERRVELLGLAAALVAARQVVDPYLIPVAREGATLRPLSQREIIRAQGPSIRLDLGKQAALAAQGSEDLLSATTSAWSEGNRPTVRREEEGHA